MRQALILSLLLLLSPAARADAVTRVDAGSNTGPAQEGDMSYVEKVKAKRAAFGNQDGIPRSSMLALRQLSFNIGMLNYTGDGLGAGASDFNGAYGGASYVSSFNDLVGWELWGGYGVGEKDYGAPAGKFAVQRGDLSFTIRVQKALLLGDQARQIHMIPHVGLGPVYSYISSMAPAAFIGGSAVGMAGTVGVDFQLGPALLGFKYRQLLSWDTSGSFPGRNMNAGIPQFSVGWAF